MPGTPTTPNCCSRRQLQFARRRSARTILIPSGMQAIRAGEYRRHAAQCLETAGTFKDHDARAALTHMAQIWLRLAHHCEDANERRRSKAAEEGHAVVQEQQQIQPKI